jgi:hypothetical protein
MFVGYKILKKYYRIYPYVGTFVVEYCKFSKDGLTDFHLCFLLDP